VNAARYFSNFYQLVQNSSASAARLLEDYHDCGIRNNDTFNSLSFENLTDVKADADWSAECLWDCTWKVNPFVGQTYKLPGLNINLNIGITLTMPKVPVDLRCLNLCTSQQLPNSFNPITLEPVDCSNSPFGSFFICYIFLRLVNSYDFDAKNGIFVSTNYADLAVESCILAILQPSFYPRGDCAKLGVNLRIFNPYLPPPYLSNSVPSSIKLQGPATQEVAGLESCIDCIDVPSKNRYPWLCSLRTPGFRGIHRCGVTLLSGPPRPTIFVSAAHCNYLCKDEEGQVVEICCCREPESLFSCTNGSFCGKNNSLQLATPKDFKIVCNLLSQEVLPQGIGYPDPVVLDIIEIRNHPKYQPLTLNSQNGGPIGGYDISVYIVDDTNFEMNPNSIWPACLPKKEDTYLPGNWGILAGWSDPLPTYLNRAKLLKDYLNQNLVTREALFERLQACSDPVWMRSTTYYPPGTACYTEAAWAGAVQFGISGSGIVRPFVPKSEANGQVRYSWAGLLSFAKGSDYTVVFDGRELINYSSNPAVFTDARCYMPWIAAQYGLGLPAGYTEPSACSEATGVKEAVNNTNCLSRAIVLDGTFNATGPLRCNFKPGFEKCQLFAYNEKAKPTYNLNFYYCMNVLDQPAICANDCPGVDPNAVVVGGEVAFLTLAAATSLAGPDLLAPALGAMVGVAGLGLGGMAMAGRRPGSCPPGQCLASGSRRCCDTVIVNRRQVCPTFC
jgi:hypothetical protein